MEQNNQTNAEIEPATFNLADHANDENVLEKIRNNILAGCGVPIELIDPNRRVNHTNEAFVTGMTVGETTPIAESKTTSQTVENGRIVKPHVVGPAWYDPNIDPRTGMPPVNHADHVVGGCDVKPPVVGPNLFLDTLIDFAHYVGVVDHADHQVDGINGCVKRQTVPGTGLYPDGPSPYPINHAHYAGADFGAVGGDVTILEGQAYLGNINPKTGVSLGVEEAIRAAHTQQLIAAIGISHNDPDEYIDIAVDSIIAAHQEERLMEAIEDAVVESNVVGHGVLEDVLEQEDHMEKYDRDIADANEKLKTLSNLGANEEVAKPAGYLGKLGDKGIVKKKDMIIHRKTSSQYRALWAAFLETEEADFKASLGYGKEEIDKIGYKKFIDFHDWSTIEDVSRWRTDIVHVIPCAHCRAEFTTFEIDLGLCSKCVSLYDMKKFADLCRTNEEHEPGTAAVLASGFVYDEEFRWNFLVENQ